MRTKKRVAWGVLVTCGLVFTGGLVVVTESFWAAGFVAFLLAVAWSLFATAEPD